MGTESETVVPEGGKDPLFGLTLVRFLKLLLGSSVHLNPVLARTLGFPCSSVGKEPACSTRDPSLIPGLGRSPGEGIGYPLQYFGASLVAQLVKNLIAMQETWV